MPIPNLHTIKGTIYDIKVDPIPGKKDPTAVYTKAVITLEVGGKYPQIPQLEYFGQNDMSMFTISDLVEIDFELTGKKLQRKDGTDYILTKPTIRSIKYADIETSKKHVKHVDPMKVDLAKHKVEIDEIAPQEEGDDLPF